MGFDGLKCNVPDFGASFCGDAEAAPSAVAPTHSEGASRASGSQDPDLVRPLDEIPERAAGPVGGHGAGGRKQRSDAAMPRRGPDDDRSHSMPEGCKLTRHSPDNDQPYWMGKLPKGMTDAEGRASRRLRWGFHTQRSEAETLALIEDWLQRNWKPPT